MDTRSSDKKNKESLEEKQKGHLDIKTCTDVKHGNANTQPVRGGCDRARRATRECTPNLSREDIAKSAIQGARAGIRDYNTAIHERLKRKRSRR